MINTMSLSVLLFIIFSINGCALSALVHQEVKNGNVLFNRGIPRYEILKTPKDVLLSQLVASSSGFNCRVYEIIALDNNEPLEVCDVLVAYYDNVNYNSVFFYKGKYVGHGGIGTFPPRFKRQIEEQLAQEAERNKPKPSVVDSTPQPRPSLAQPIPPKREPVLKGSGSGFYINSDGYMLTNYHVVEGCSYLSTFKMGEKVSLSLISSDPVNDLAVLKSEQESLSYAQFRSGKGLKRGDEITVIGYPLRGLLSSDATATFGYVNALRGMKDDSSRMQISAQIQAGNSGGPVLDNGGNIVGVVVSSVSDKYLYERSGTIPQNANFAINGLFARTFLDAREISYKLASGSEELTKTDIVDKGTSFTAQVLCYE